MRRRLGGLGATSVAAVLAALALGLAACGDDDDDSSSDSGGSADSSKPIVIGQVKGFTGFMEAFDLPPATAAELAVEDINQAGGVNGRKLEIVTADNQTEVERGRRAAAQAIEDGAEYIQTTCDFDLGAPIAAEAQKQGIVAASDCAGSIQFGPAGIGPLAFTFGTPGLTEGLAIAEYGAQELGVTKTFSLTDAALEYYAQVIAGYKQGVEREGTEIVGEDTYKSTDPSIAPSIKRIKESGAEAILLAGLPEGGAAAMRQIRSAGVDLPILTSNTFDGEAWKAAVPDISDVYFTTYASIFGDDPSDFFNKLVVDYEKKSGQKAENANIITGYAVIEAFKVAAERCKCTDGEGIAAEFEKFDNEPLVDGALPTTFTEDLHATLARPLAIMEVQDGKTSHVTIWEVSEPPEAEL